MQQQRIIHHLEKLVAYYPHSNDQPAVRRVLEYCQKILETTNSFKDATMHEHNGVYSLTASTQGTKHPLLLLEGHVDVVACSETPKLEMTDDGATLVGRGVYDMLFAVACYLVFIEEHQAELPQLDLGLMLTGDEELGGFNGAGYLVEQGYGGSICFLPDAGENFGDLSIAAKGAYNFDLVVTGVAHHGSRPWEGDGAANKLVKLLGYLVEAFDASDKANSTMTITQLNSGDSLNKGPCEATAHIDIRYKDAEDYERIKEVVAQLCSENDAELQNVLEADNTEMDSENEYLQKFIALYAQHAEKTISLSKAHGGSDARFFSVSGTPVIMLRPDGTGAHGDHETLDTASMNKFYQLLEDYTFQTAKI